MAVVVFELWPFLQRLVHPSSARRGAGGGGSPEAWRLFFCDFLLYVVPMTMFNLSRHRHPTQYISHPSLILPSERGEEIVWDGDRGFRTLAFRSAFSTPLFFEAVQRVFMRVISSVDLE